MRLAHMLLVAVCMLGSRASTQDSVGSSCELKALEILLERGIITQAEFEERIGRPRQSVAVKPAAADEQRTDPAEPVSVAPDPEESESAESLEPESAVFEIPENRPSALSRSYLRAAVGTGDHDEWDSLDVLFVEGSRDLSGEFFAFAEAEFSSGEANFDQASIALGSGWDRSLSERAAAFLKVGFFYSYQEYEAFFGDIEDEEDSGFFFGGGLRGMLAEETLGEFEILEGSPYGGFGLRVEQKLGESWGVFAQLRQRSDYDTLCLGVSLYL